MRVCDIVTQKSVVINYTHDLSLYINKPYNPKALNPKTQPYSPKAPQDLVARGVANREARRVS